MSVFHFFKDLCHSIQSSINKFWWGHRHEERKLHWLGSSKLCRSKDDGGLGFRDMEAFNKALLAKQVWRLCKYESSLVARVLRAKYYPKGDIYNVVLSPKPSFTWRSLFGARDVIRHGSR